LLRNGTTTPPISARKKLAALRPIRLRGERRRADRYGKVVAEQGRGARAVAIWESPEGKGIRWFFASPQRKQGYE
jgi:hypothetical protein